MPSIVSVGRAMLPYQIRQDLIQKYIKQLFSPSFRDINRLVAVFRNGQIESRYFVKDLDWYSANHSFSEKNDAYIENSLKFSCEAIINCLENRTLLDEPINIRDIDAIIYISTTGLATPSMDARIMNVLPFSPHTKRIPIWGLGCAGGAAGLARAYEYCLAYPKARVLVVAAEFCSLTFQPNDLSKSNIIGTSLFADGVACVCVAGDEVEHHRIVPRIISTQSTLMSDAEDVMGWDVRDEGFFVIFSKDIPSIIYKWVKQNVDEFLDAHGLTINDIQHFIAHPGGKKVIEAYQNAFHINEEKTKITFEVLQNYGNMSSATVYFVLEQFMNLPIQKGEYGLVLALGPGFSAELVLLKWG